jgi:hypothetical protein
MNFTKRDKKPYVEQLLDDQLEHQLEQAGTIEEIAQILTLLERKNALGDKKRISPDTLAVIAGNLLGIVLILTYEKVNVITTKALGFIIRGRV